VETSPDPNARPGRLSGRTAVVTGGCRGLGREIAGALVAAGARVLVTGRDTTALKEAVGSLNPGDGSVRGYLCDVRDEAGLAAMAADALTAFGRIDVLVHNSGIAGPTAPLWETAPEQWRETVETNLTGAFLACRSVLPCMVARGSGSVVVIGSMTGKRPLYGRTPYAASKTGLIGLVRTLALEAGPHGVRVNLVSPGPLEGERMDRVFAAQAAGRGISAEAARTDMLSQSPLGRLVPSADVASAVTFLAGDEAASVTGEDLNVSAGLVMH
jgi:NAD(P)-dependent dehydrogenase (short-subunit alcohol dehydrogenase family)